MTSLKRYLLSSHYTNQTHCLSLGPQKNAQQMNLLRVLLSLLLAALMICSGLGCARDSATINIASEDFTEQYILGEILLALVQENTELEVNLTSGIVGETSIIMPAMEAGDFDLYAEYDSTAWMTVLKMPHEKNIEWMHSELNRIYEETYSMRWLGFYGFNNTYGLAMRKETAEYYGIVTYSDLALQSSHIVFGAGYEFFEREDGYDGLQEMYDFSFKDIEEMNLNLKYEALLNGNVDVITIYRTDGRMSNPELVLLVDDKEYFPPAYCGTVVRIDTLERYPELLAVLEMLNDNISDEEMRLMNAQVDMEGREAREVAREFLARKGLI